MNITPKTANIASSPSTGAEEFCEARINAIIL